MKKIIILLSSLLLANCTDNFEKINRNPYGVTDQEIARLPIGGSELQSLQKLVLPQQENSYQMCFDLFATGYAGYASQTKFRSDYPVYSPRTGWINYVYDDTYPKIYTPYFKLKALAKGDYTKPYFALGSIFRVGITGWLTDTFGPLPYTQVTEGKFTVPYDSQENIYLAMCEELKASIEGLKTIPAADRQYATFDNVYRGDLTKWQKYANSLLLRLAIRMSDAAPAKAKEYAEYAVNNGVILSNEDNAALSTVDNPAFKVSANWGDSRVNAEITEYMNAYEDPRREKYFTKVTTRPDNPYFGLRSGNTSTTFEKANYSLPNITASSPIVWISAAEVAFLKAEGALRGWNMGGTPKELYEQGIRLSFEQWGASLGNYLENNRKRGNFQDDLATTFNTTFSSKISVKWNEEGSKEDKLSKIITQKWIAMFPYGSQEAWAEWRRTGYPNFMPATENNSGGIIADIQQVDGKDVGGMRRLPFSTNENINNPANMVKAITLLGGANTGATNLWWAKK